MTEGGGQRKVGVWALMGAGGGRDSKGHLGWYRTQRNKVGDTDFGLMYLLSPFWRGRSVVQLLMFAML